MRPGCSGLSGRVVLSLSGRLVTLSSPSLLGSRIPVLKILGEFQFLRAKVPSCFVQFPAHVITVGKEFCDQMCLGNKALFPIS